MSVYIVQGSAGEYDGYHEWNVRAFLKLESAEAFLLKLRTELSKTKCGRKREGMKNGKKLDRDFDSCNDYNIEVVELESE
jgi:hypothetical protein